MCAIGSEIDLSEPIFFVCMLVALTCAMCTWIETLTARL
nr:MAG TPA: hypothetical protein [Caudoviricetes sp.]